MFSSNNKTTITLLGLVALPGLLVQAAPQIKNITPFCVSAFCPAGESCVGNSCCKTTEACGTACCRNSNPGPNLFTVHCANASKSLCCIIGTVDTNGICCQSGQVNCGGTCCSGTCGKGNVCQMKDAECKKMWGQQSNSCTLSNQCVGGWGCLNGCCYKIPTK